ncbi:MAG TPA: SAM-dependent methyltransferase [Actinobacteria bacterium]|nr:SAM-dependent methyltransferase [Actinomycetota bacterium]
MPDYDREARHYDATRGGDARAEAAAQAIRTLLPAREPGEAGQAGAAAGQFTVTRPLTVADVGCGTGIVTMRLAGPGRRVLGIDRSAGMAAVAEARLPGRIALGSALRLPLADASVDVVTMVWLLHLLDEAGSAAAIAETARVLRPGGFFITTVAKNEAAWATANDLAALVAPVQAAHAGPPTDGLSRVTGLAEGHGLRFTGGSRFTGCGQGRSPRRWRENLRSGRISWAGRAGQDRIAGLCAALAALPGQDVPRPDPVYQLVALHKKGAA